MKRSVCCQFCGTRVEIRHYSGTVLCDRCSRVQEERIGEHNKEWEKKRAGKK